MSAQPRRNIVIVANRLPVRQVEFADGTVGWASSPGGLVSALRPVMADANGMTWVGWAGVDSPETKAFTADGLDLVPVPISTEELTLHYDGMSNGTLWPLYHDKVAPVAFHRRWYEGYRKVNQRFAEATAEAAAPDSLVWVHDYQLQLVPQMLRELRDDLHIGFFTHIPFPPSELFIQLPWREELSRGILGSDLVGFQTPNEAGNFRRMATGLGVARADGTDRLAVDGRPVRIGSYPIGIDAGRYEEASRSHTTTEACRDLRARIGQPHVVLLGVDRLDYTKGIDVRLRAYKELLSEGRIHPSQVTMIQVAEPSRDNVDAYVTLRGQVEQMVGEINGDYSRVGFPAIHYIHQTQDFESLMSLYRAADVMLVTPFRDGMNLVAKEYVATRYDETGVLILSQFAGAAHQLTDALIVNPYDTAGVKAAIMDALEMSPEEKRLRMKSLRQSVSEETVQIWARSFIDALAA